MIKKKIKSACLSPGGRRNSSVKIGFSLGFQKTDVAERGLYQREGNSPTKKKYSQTGYREVRGGKVSEDARGRILRGKGLVGRGCRIIPLGLAICRGCLSGRLSKRAFLKKRKAVLKASRRESVVRFPPPCRQRKRPYDVAESTTPTSKNR